MTLRFINAAEVRQLLPMPRCIDVMADAMKAASAGAVSVPARICMPLEEQSGYLFVMPGSVSDPPFYGTKVISQHPGNPARELPAIQGFVALFDHETGTPAAIVDGAEITALRTAAASGLATRHLARTDARTHGIIGTGVQALTHIEAIASVAAIDEVLIWGRDSDKAQRLAAELNIRACSDPQEVAGCDIVSTVTGSDQPVIRGDWVQPGAHINLVGAHTPDTREADSDLMAKGSVFVDLMESAMNESGDILIPISEGRFESTHVRGEIGLVVAEELDGRQSSEEVTVYVSLGIMAQDLYAAHAVYRAALEAGLGTDVSL
jgi:ornithine cyclodeaminase